MIRHKAGSIGALCFVGGKGVEENESLFTFPPLRREDSPFVGCMYVPTTMFVSAIYLFGLLALFLFVNNFILPSHR
jgi:hypothetical protein